MTLTHILILTVGAFLYILLLPRHWREWALFGGSILAIYWLQPVIIIRWLDFLFPTLTLGIVVLSWVAARDPDQHWTREDSIATGVIVSGILLLSLGRFIIPEYRLTASIPPEPFTVALWLAGAGIMLTAVYHFPQQQKRISLYVMLLILVAFIVLKTEPLAVEISRQMRIWEGRPTRFASANELSWLGFSYVAFRLIHTLRDRQTGRLPALSLRDYITYTIFFPAFTAGPIDRAERFLSDLQSLPDMLGRDANRIVQGGMRIAVGIGKKFVIADSLAYMALDSTNAEQATSAGGLWILLYAYTLQIYFDFSGYSDIAIGLGQLFGIKLPENFNQPYLKRNITLFWQSWHMTLSQWVRFYIFSPLTRTLLKRKRKPSPITLALIGQVTTMLVIGLWHGISWGFVTWGLWHGIGLFIHKVYSDKTRSYYIQMRDHPYLNQVIGIAGIFITFHFVALGWVWFALSDISTSWAVFVKLLGM